MAALKDKRATLAGEIVQYKRQIRAREKALAHLDQTIKLLSLDFDVTKLKPKKAYNRTQLFRQGELSRLTQDALRKADRPLTYAEIIASVMEAIKAPDSAQPTMARRVANLIYLKRKDSVEAVESENGGKVWELAVSD